MISHVEDITMTFSRKYANIEDFGRFKFPEKTFDKQYSNIYNARLAALKEILKKKAKEKWVHHTLVQISNLSENENKKFVIIMGTLYKHQELKPSVLKELSVEVHLIPQPSRSHYSSDKDQLFLEDEKLRIKLVGPNINSKEMVTGLVCTVLGHKLDDGSFFVEDYCMPGICPRAGPSSLSSTNEKKQLLLLSGMDLINDTNLMAYELLVEFINGMAGNTDAQNIGATITQVIIAGNCSDRTESNCTYHSFSKKKKIYSSAALSTTLAIYKLDNLLRQIAETCCLIVMPAQFDPSNHSIPQQPFHPCIFPKASKYKSFYATTNPWIGKIENRIIAGSSGQPIDDIMKVTGLVEYSPLEWLEKTLLWRHFAPTVPDTLSAYSYFNCDPFVMQECPDIYFVGNMEKYASKFAFGDEGQIVRLISIPKFSKTHTAAVVDLESLNTWPISFGTS